LTDDPSVDTSPSWSPQGRKIAFVSTRGGSAQIWVADLDRSDTERFSCISNEAENNHLFPVWSPDGRYLAWSSERGGEHRLMVWDSRQPEIPAGWSGYGDRLAWSPDGALLITQVEEPNQTALMIYERGTARERMPLFDLPGQAYGLSWSGPVEGWLAEAVSRGDSQPAPVLVQPVLTLAPNQPASRIGLVEITDLSAPIPMLSDAADEAFQVLRLQAAIDSGWDILSSLEQAYLPLTTPATPSIQEEWLYTGRAFALNPLILNAGWMAVQREDFYGQTYWRVYLKARFQDGSAGVPLEAPVWDLNARYSGDTTSYELGGQKVSPAGGYWIDLTELAHRYGWERLASKTNWRTFYPAIRFNQFVFRQGLDWNAAMTQMYPAEALATPTSVPTATGTSTPTQGATRFRTTFTPTPTPTSSPTRRPTFTRQP
jgi:TolB protein